MSSLAPQTAGSSAKVRRFRNWRYRLLGIVCLFVVSGIALYLWVNGLPLSWTADYDRVAYSRITRAIAADPKHLCGRRLDDVSRELGLGAVPWDDGNVQNVPGSLRTYHFRGFALWVTLDYMRQGVTESMLLDRGSPEEKQQARELLRINLHVYPSVWIDGLASREARMKIYWEREEEAMRQVNEQMRLRRQQNPG